MNKSVLIIDKPNYCMECPLNYQDDACYITETSFKDIEPKEEILEDCPLKDLPPKQTCNDYNFENFVNGRIKGWNDYHDMLVNGKLGEYDEKVDGTIK